MTKRRLLKISLGLLVVIGLFIVIAQRDRGPLVDGRPLEDWVQDLLVTGDPARRDAAQEAVAGLGTNAVPWLRRTLRYTDPVWKRPLISVVDSVPLLEREDIQRWANTYELSEIRAGGVAGLAALGQAATPAIPDLVTALGDPEHLVYNNALVALRSMGAAPLGEITNRLGRILLFSPSEQTGLRVGDGHGESPCQRSRHGEFRDGLLPIPTGAHDRTSAPGTCRGASPTDN